MKLFKFAIALVFAFLAAAAFAQETQNSDKIDPFVEQVKQNRDNYKSSASTSSESSASSVSSVAETAKQQGVEPLKKYILIPFQFSLFPLAGPEGFLGDRVINHVSINILCGYSAKLSGFEAGVINFKNEEVKGVQLAGVMNYSGGSMSGFQSAGAANMVIGDVNGLQASGSFNYAGNVEGAQLGPVNFSLRSAWIQIGTLNGAGKVDMMQAGVINMANELNGFQPGVINIANNLNGFQPGVINIAGKFNGLQAGVINVSAKKSSGAQIGVINYSEDIDGASIGLISIVKNGPVNAFVWYDDMRYINAGIKHGSKYIYNIYGVGMDSTRNYMKETLGIGGHIPLWKFFINLDGTFSSIHSIDNPGTSVGLLSSARLSTGFSFFEHLSITAGITLNQLTEINGSVIHSVSTASDIHSYKAGNADVKIWPGFFAGIEF